MADNSIQEALLLALGDPDHEPTERGSFLQPKELFKKKQRNLRFLGLLLFVYLLAGVLIFYLVMDQMSGERTNRALDALYLVVVTMTSVGCGDLVPSSDTTKLLACAFVFTGVGVISLLVTKLADHVIEKQAVFLKELQNDEAKVMAAIDTSDMKYKCYTVALLLVVDVAAGIVFLWKAEGMSLVDSLYCVFYGDKSFPSTAGRLFAIVWIVASTIILAQFFEYLSDFYVERQKKRMAQWVLTRGTTVADLEAADMDGDQQVSVAEFVLYKLREMGKISQEEESFLVEEFVKLQEFTSPEHTRGTALLQDRPIIN